jgi:hypothetical protein
LIILTFSLTYALHRLPTLKATSLLLPSAINPDRQRDLDPQAPIFYISTLAHTEKFLALVDPGSPLAARGRVDPVWTYATQLVHLQLEVPQEGPHERTQGDVEEVLDVFVRDTLFSDGSWLGLRNGDDT